MVFPADWQATNLLMMAGTTHIMTKSQVPCFVKDSVVGFKDQANVLSQVPRGKELRLMTIPAGTTYLCQPLDVYFFRLFKRYIRRLHDYAIQRPPEFAAVAETDLF
ncbi:unnamed protein product [Nippostrongylus brasiliensis]|uniref:DDE-1 domain-containing protein n=1 Tax=Nippostrongylus brasiliensis TaxID=27835 RepID=A0A0N4YA43_NIPBR|nr:unnamed protein product [Nippostrongylus brasiliensis]